MAEGQVTRTFKKQVGLLTVRGLWGSEQAEIVFTAVRCFMLVYNEEYSRCNHKTPIIKLIN